MPAQPDSSYSRSYNYSPPQEVVVAAEEAAEAALAGARSAASALAEATAPVAQELVRVSASVSVSG